MPKLKARMCKTTDRIRIILLHRKENFCEFDATNWEMKAQPVRMSWIWKIKTSQAVMDLRNYDIIDGN